MDRDQIDCAQRLLVCTCPSGVGPRGLTDRPGTYINIHVARYVVRFRLILVTGKLFVYNFLGMKICYY